jgi:hypothetical protein
MKLGPFLIEVQEDEYYRGDLRKLKNMYVK